MTHRPFAIAQVTGLLLLAACQSGIELDPQGAYRCVPQSSTERTRGGCPAALFCGADRTCHPEDVGGDYPCAGDFGCGGGFRCGPVGRCVDPKEDALRTDAPEVVLSVVADLGSGNPWDTVSAIGAGRTFLSRSSEGQMVDVTPLAIADAKSVFSVGISTQGFTPTEKFYLGKATFASPVLDVAAVRQQVYAITDGGLFHYGWLPDFDGGVATLLPGPPEGAIGDRLRVGNSAFPIVAELNSTRNQYRLHDSARNLSTGPVPLAGPRSRIDDLVDTDGKYLYGSFDGVLHVADRADALFAIANNGNAVSWTPVGLVSPGRGELLTDCSGASAPKGDRLTVRAIHVGDNPDLTQIERPLVALEIEVTRPDGGVLPTHWMRVDPDPQSPPCGAVPRHLARGFCPACGPGEKLRELQWGRETGLQPVLRAECAGTDGGSAFYDLQTDSTGFACLRERRLNVAPPGRVEVRQRSSATVDAVAIDSRLYLRREGLEPYVPLTLDHAPLAIEMLPPGRIALGNRTVFRELPVMGLAISSFVPRSEPFPSAIASGSPWVIFDNGRVTALSQLGRGGGEPLAAHTRTDLRPPFAGTRAVGTDGRPFLLMSSFDALLVADMSNPANVAHLEVRVVPEAQVPILSVVAVPPPAAPPDGGSLVSGYALTENRVFSLAAATETQWEARALAAPEGDWAELFVDQRRARLGYRDGTVAGLPSGVLIAPKLAAGPVRDYAQYCGRSFALTADALYRLDSTGQPVGAWTKQTIPQLSGGRWVRLYDSRTGELWVFSDDGRAVALRGAPCG